MSQADISAGAYLLFNCDFQIYKMDLQDHQPATEGSSNRMFGFVFTGVFIVIACFPLIGGSGIRFWALVVAAIILVVSLVAAPILAPLNRQWTKFGLMIHRFTNPIILGVIFFGVITPTALIARLLKKDFLKLKLDPDAETYWVEREPHGPKAKQLKDQF